MLRRDLATFMILFASFLVMSYFTLYVLYPRAGDVYLPFVMEYNQWYTAMKALVEVGFTGSLPSARPPPLNTVPAALYYTAALSIVVLREARWSLVLGSHEHTGGQLGSPLQGSTRRVLLVAVGVHILHLVRQQIWANFPFLTDY